MTEIRPRISVEHASTLIAILRDSTIRSYMMPKERAVADSFQQKLYELVELAELRQRLVKLRQDVEDGDNGEND